MKSAEFARADARGIFEVHNSFVASFSEFELSKVINHPPLNNFWCMRREFLALSSVARRPGQLFIDHLTEFLSSGEALGVLCRRIEAPTVQSRDGKPAARLIRPTLHSRDASGRNSIFKNNHSVRVFAGTAEP
jgi:hypothetical protein